MEVPNKKTAGLVLSSPPFSFLSPYEYGYESESESGRTLNEQNLCRREKGQNGSGWEIGISLYKLCLRSRGRGFLLKRGRGGGGAKVGQRVLKVCTHVSQETDIKERHLCVELARYLSTAGGISKTPMDT